MRTNINIGKTIQPLAVINQGLTTKVVYEKYGVIYVLTSKLSETLKRFKHA